MKTYAYLLKIDAKENYNRFYRMLVKDDVLIVEMGRVGAAPVITKRPPKFFKMIYEQKIREGYVDRSDYVMVNKVTSYKEIEDQDVKTLFQSLTHYANAAIQESYTVQWESVTKKQLEHAQSLIEEISDMYVIGKDIKEIQDKILLLYITIPRKTKDVKNSLPNKREDIPKFLEEEQSLLDTLRTKLLIEKTTIDDKMTLPESLGLDVRICTNTENEQIKKFLTKESARYFKRAFRIHNKKTDKAFDEYCKSNCITKEDIHYFYHGSKNRNYMGILTEGLLLNPKAPITGKMFGYGIYLAPRAKKSLRYTDLKGEGYYTNGSNNTAYLAVFKAAYKNPYHVNQHEPWMQSIRKSSQLPHNSDALYAHAGISLLNDEVIVYREAQITLQYLIELEK